MYTALNLPPPQSPHHQVAGTSDYCLHPDPNSDIDITLAGIFWNRAASEPPIAAAQLQPVTMTRPPATPQLSPQFCFSTSTLRGMLRTLEPKLNLMSAEFFRFSRSAVDDTISQNLNALVTPARGGFDPSSTSQRTSRKLGGDINVERCAIFLDKILFPAWDSRAQVFEYCAAVASSPDPDDPETALRELQRKQDSKRVVDERLDPYSGRFYPCESRTELLASTLRQERVIEDIVRHRTWEVIQDRCQEPPKDWQAAIDIWKKHSANRK
ncbi:Caffeine-induced death protein 2 [Cordyceps fumosorosea ARSEF 2679]|uniref:Caffeine-induced death protein 2 n=1 Tax=Cordyceps fumosorosea (strain ARSEF 2679) TaxID=1081104 RepID=A0A167LG65_CORFA|nr:Caffeine-induced death protein 2 [Cordyceps fumosorosea ARSEF 2679]OAA53053.1 Caffeine-induced death protein 2 [Cordyceps fumosorosea ARSEF 2679]